MKKSIILVAIAATLIPSASFAAAKSKVAAPTTYQCSTCHMKFTAAQAKKDHFKDPMDGGKLVPVHAAKSTSTMSGMKM